MSYYFATQLENTTFDKAVSKTKDALKEHGFGVLTEIDMKATLKKKMDADFHNYKILGACNPPLAYEALQSEDKIGTMLPCNVIVQELQNGAVEIAAVNPVASMQAVKNDALNSVAVSVRDKLKKVISNLGA